MSRLVAESSFMAMIQRPNSSQWTKDLSRTQDQAWMSHLLNIHEIIASLVLNHCKVSSQRAL